MLCLIASFFSLLACDPEGSKTPSGIESPGPEATAVAPIVTLPIQFVIVNPENTGITGATVEMSSTTLGPIQQKTDSTGLSEFKDMRVDQDYQVIVSAPGYKPAERLFNPLSIQKQNPNSENQLLLSIELDFEKTTLSGEIKGTDGKQLEHAIVFDGTQSTLTDAEGKFTLSYQAGSAIRLDVSHPRYFSKVNQYQLQLEEKKDIGTLSLAPKSQPLVVGIDGSKEPLGLSGSSGLSQFNTLTQTLSSEGFSVQTIETTLIESLSQIDILFLPSPSKAYSIEEMSAIQSFVKGGKKLVVLGEWGGFSGFQSQNMNELLAPFHMKLGGDTLRESNQSFIPITTFQPHPITKEIKSIHIYQSGTVQLDSQSNGALLARTTQNGFRISNLGSFGFLAAGIYGNGRIVLSADASLWLDADSDSNGTANISEADNLKLLKQVFAW